MLRLTKVGWRGSRRLIWKELQSRTMICRWSELRVVMVRHSEFIAMRVEAVRMLLEVGEAGRRIKD